MGIALITNNILSDSGASLSGYVPYTGATANVDLGFRTLNALTLTAQGSASEGGVLNIKKFATRTVAGIGYFSLAASDGSIAFYENTAGTSKAFNLLTSSITGNTTKNYTMPNADGTIALTSDLSGYLPLTGGTISGTLQVGGTFNQLYLGASKSSLYLDASRYVMSTISTYGIAFEIGVTPVLSIPTSGNVLINTTTDSGYKLDVNGTGRFSSSVTGSGLIAKGTGSFNVNNNIRFLRGTGTEMGYIGWSDETVNNSTWLFKSSNGNPIALSADGINQQFILTTAGNVGIGTTSPMTFGSFTNLTIASSATNNFSAIFLVNSSVSIRGSWYQNGGNQINFGTATAHPLVFDTNDVERMRITSGGDVGIGNWTTNVPQDKLHINGALQVGFVNSLNSALRIYWNGASSYGAIQTSSSSALSLNPGGNNVLIGTTTDNGYKLRVNGNVWFDGSLNATNAAFNQNGTTSVYLSNTSVSGGSSSGVTGLYMGDSGSGVNVLTREKISFNTARTYIYTEHGYNTQAVGAYFYNGAAYQGNNSAAWSVTSDRRIKDNIRPLNNSLEKLLALNPCHFEYKNRLGKTKTGFIAQEFEEVLPGHVHEQTAGAEYAQYIGEGNTIKSIDTDLIPYLVKAIQEQQVQIEELKQLLNK